MFSSSQFRMEGADRGKKYLGFLFHIRSLFIPSYSSTERDWRKVCFEDFGGKQSFSASAALNIIFNFEPKESCTWLNYSFFPRYLLPWFKSCSLFLPLDAATIIVVNLYIRSFAKIDDVKMVSLDWWHFQKYLNECNESNHTLRKVFITDITRRATIILPKGLRSGTINSSWNRECSYIKCEGVTL